MECFNAFEDHEDELLEYATAAFISCISDIINLIIKKGIEAIVLVLTEAKNSYGPFISLSQTTRLELPGTGLTIDED